MSSFSSIAPPPDGYLMKIDNQYGRPLVTIDQSGLVTIHEKCGEDKAAEMFWSAIQIRGQTLIARIRQLEAEVNDLDDALAEERDRASSRP